jgi:DNA-directed RNA polymerase subunit RPC12/RpoP
MGTFGRLQCTVGCAYDGASLCVGAGMHSVRAVKRCAACGGITDVLAARIEQGDVVPASGRGRCPDCASQRLRDAEDIEAIIDGAPGVVACPRCGAPLSWREDGIWD